MASFLLLMRYHEGDANIRSVWLCSRNDAIVKVAVMCAPPGVFGTGSAWPDLLVASVMSALFLSASASILRRVWAEYHNGETGARATEAR